MDGVLGGLDRVLLPRLAVVAAEDDDLALAAAQTGEVRHLDDHRPATASHLTLLATALHTTHQQCKAVGTEKVATLGTEARSIENGGGGGVPQELRADGPHLEDAAGERLALHQRRRVDELLALHQLARHARRHARLARRDDDAHARVTTAAHGAAASVDHEAHQEAANTRHCSCATVTRHCTHYHTNARNRV